MGLGIAAVQNTLELWQQGFFKNTNKVFEMGSQELHLKTTDFEDMVKMAGVNNFEKEKFPNLDNWPKRPLCSSRSLYKMLGIDEYLSFDINEEHGAISHDYNIPFEDTTLYSQFDLVTDHGSCEHAFNIAESYRTMHRLCKPGGLIVIAQMLWGGNGYFLYDKHFIEGVAAANNYKIMFNSYVICTGTKTRNGSDHQFHIPMNKDLLMSIDLNRVGAIGVYAVIQKQNDADFKFPYQGQYLSEQQGNMGFNRVFHHDSPGYSYIPEYRKEIPGRELFKQLLKKIRNRIIKFR
jgi:SAM-dependent methyltransferase